MPATGRDNWRQVSRATAAHSTVTFNDTSSCRFLDSVTFRGLFGVAIVDGPESVSVSREIEDHTTVLRTAHDGYADRFGIIHERFISLSEDGNDSTGKTFFSRPPAMRCLRMHSTALPSASTFIRRSASTG